MIPSMHSGMSAARRLRRHWALWAACALFVVTGALALDDYGVGNDEGNQRAIGMAALDYLAGEGERAFEPLASHFNATDRFYGAAFEAPLVLAERILGLDDSRSIHLARHFLTHLFFLAGGVFCYLLVYRLFGNRALALVAMALFLLHPRIYAHSFFNSKDAPFLAAFMIALYLTHRAFRRDTLAAFLLCGAGVGLLVNLRVMGIVLFAAVLVLRALDLPFASSRERRRRVLLAGGAFALAAILTFHAASPILWTDPPGRFVETLRVFGSFPNQSFNLFRGEWLYAPDGPPFAYVPVWVGITTPPATLALALIGVVALAWRGVRRPRALLRDGPVRFGLLLLAIPVVTAVAVVALESNLYSGWRQLYFLYAPLLLLAITGLHWLTASSHGRWPRAGAYALAGAALAVAVVAMVRIHPHQDSSFTALTDRAAPERLAARYDVNYWNQSGRDALAAILGDYPDGPIRLASPHGLQRLALHRHDRERIAVTRDFRSGERNFHELRDGQPCPDGAAYVSRVHATTLYCIVDPVAYFGELRRETLAAEPLARSRFDARRVGNLMVYLRDGCSREDMEARFFLRAYPVDAADLPARLRRFPGHRSAYGFEMRDFDFRQYGARIDGDCVAVAPLPGYPIARIETGQYTPAWAESARRAVAEAEPLARSWFDVHPVPDGRALTYVRDDCTAEDAEARFFLHVHPADRADLPEHRTRHGFDNLNFGLRERGARTDGGSCVAVAPLPQYPIASIRTGQFTADGRLWEARFALPE